MSDKSESSKTQLEALEAHLLEKLLAKLKPSSKRSFNIQVELIEKLLELLDEGTDESREQAKKLLVDWKALLITGPANPKTSMMTEAAKEMKALTEAGGESLTEQSFAIQGLVRGLSDLQVRLMWHFIEPLFRKDFLSQLPEEVAYRIIGYLRPCDLMTCASVSRTWRRLYEDGQTWRQRCLEKGYVKFDAPSFRFLGGWAAVRANEESGNEESGNEESGNEESGNEERAKAICSQMDLQEADQNRREREIGYGQCYERSSWKSLYLRKMRIISNWRSRVIQSSTVKHASTVCHITDLQIHSGRIVTHSGDTMRVWNVDDAQLALTLAGHTDYISTSQVSDNGKYIVSGSNDRTVRVWCGQTGAQLNVLRGHTDSVVCMSLHGTTLVSGSDDQTLRVWDIVDGKRLHILVGHLKEVGCVQFDGERIVSGSDDSTVKVWNVHTGECLHTLTGHTDKIRSLLFEPERDLVVSDGGDGTTYVWDVRKGTCILQIVGRRGGWVNGTQLCGNILVYYNYDSDVEVWDIRDGGSCTYVLQVENHEESEISEISHRHMEEISEISHHHMGGIESFQLLDSGLLVTSSNDGSVKLWDVNKGTFVRDLLRVQPYSYMRGLKATETLLVCAFEPGNQTGEKLTLVDFDAAYP